MARKSHPHHYSARVDAVQNAQLDGIKAVYGEGANPSAIASTLLRHAASVGPNNYHVFMREVAALSGRLKGQASE